jgi:predicted phage baseplate assembly protein
VAARGGRDSESLDEAKYRSRKELSTRFRAVTAEDFSFIAKQTRGVRVAHVEVVPLRRPLDPSLPFDALSPVRCSGRMPEGPAGLDTTIAHGAVSLVVVPDLPDPDDPEPIPTPSFLTAVCRHVDQHRLVTTEVHVVPPQYLRLCNFRITARSEPGYTRTQLQTLIENNLMTYLHVIKGGEDGLGFPFGSQLHVSELIALVFRTEGVDRVEDLSAEFTRTKTNLPQQQRQGRLVQCPTAEGISAGDVSEVQLAPEENVSVDISTLTLTTVV